MPEQFRPARAGMGPTADTGLSGEPGPTALLADPRTARRLRRPSWRDPRLLVGLLLVLGSVLAGAAVVRAADHTVPVYRARHTLTPGQALDVDDLAVARVRISGGAAAYLSAATGPPAQVALRTVGAGELIPIAAVGAASAVVLRPVAVPVSADVAEGLAVGALVDVWVADVDEERGHGFVAPHLVAADAEVADRTTRTSTFGASSTATVRLLLRPDLVPQVIGAVDNGARISVLPVPVTHPAGAR